MPCPSITGTRNCISINQTALIQPHNQRCPPTIVERRGTILWFACQPFIHGHEPRRSPCITSRPEEQKSSGVRLDKLLPIRINLCGRYRRGGRTRQTCRCIERSSCSSEKVRRRPDGCGEAVSSTSPPGSRPHSPHAGPCWRFSRPNFLLSRAPATRPRGNATDDARSTRSTRTHRVSRR